MPNYEKFKKWLTENKPYTKATIGDMVSRLKRADSILPWFEDEVYFFRLDKENKFQELSCSVKSQIRKSVRLYFEFIEKSSREE